MGIPRFFQWIKQHYPSTLDKVNSTHVLNKSIDHLYLDMNGIFHTVCQEVFEYGKYDRMRKSFKLNSVQDLNERSTMAYQKIAQYIHDVVTIVQPKKSLVLTIDGVAPLSKQAQQRQRRFRACMERMNKSKNNEIRFDSNSITPGTTFLHNLGIFLHYYIAQKITHDERWQKFTVIYSDDKVPGEGEHKIINYIRMRKATNDEFLSDVHCMYGLDADLVMLSLATHLQHFYLLREDIYSSDMMDFYLVDIGLFRTFLHLQLSVENCNINSLIDDFILICFLVGNDFLPHQPTIEILTQGIEIMFLIYEKVFKKGGHLTRGNEINWVAVSNFFNELGKMEGDLLVQKIMKDDMTYPDPLLKSSAMYTADGSIDFRFTDWRMMYYFNKLGISPDSSDQLDKLCLDYCIGLKWVFQYYKSGCPSWRWTYKHHYTPLVSDVAFFLKNQENINRITNFQMDEPILPFYQLLSVLPYGSRHLLPKPLQKLVHNKSSIGEFYPSTFYIDRDGKKYDWEGTVILPFIDIDRVITAADKIIFEMSQDEIGHRVINSRNCIHDNKAYQFSENSNYTYKNKFGFIENCKAKFNDIKF